MKPEFKTMWVSIVVMAVCMTFSMPAKGNTEFFIACGGPELDSAEMMRQTPDGGYVMVGTSISWDIEDYGDLLLMKFDQDGELEWTQTVGVPGTYDEDPHLCLTSDGGYFVAAHTWDWQDRYQAMALHPVL